MHILRGANTSSTTTARNELLHVYGSGVPIRGLDLVTTRKKIVQAMTAALKYEKSIRNKAPALAQSDNAREYIAAATVDTDRKFGTRNSTIIPHNPEENGLTEWLKSTIMNGVICELTTAKMPAEYSPLAMANSTFKHNLIVHASTGKSKYRQWTGDTNPLPPMFALGQMGWMTSPPHTPKFNARGKRARYIGVENEKQIIIGIEKVKVTKV